MPRDRLDNVLISPDRPSNIVCSRHVTEMVGRRGRAAAVGPQSLPPLLRDLPAEPVAYRESPGEALAELSDRVGPDTQLFDLPRRPPSAKLCASLLCLGTGVGDDYYCDPEVCWSITPNDPSHYSGRRIRAHLPVETLGLLLDSQAVPWDSYPDRVECLALGLGDVSRRRREVVLDRVSWLADRRGSVPGGLA